MALENENATYRHGFVAEGDEETPFDKESEEEIYVIDNTEIQKAQEKIR